MVRHAHASRAQIQLTHGRGRLSSQMMAPGFAARDAHEELARLANGREPGSGLGMLGMRERALLIGAQSDGQRARPALARALRSNSCYAFGLRTEPHDADSHSSQVERQQRLLVLPPAPYNEGPLPPRR